MVLPHVHDRSVIVRKDAGQDRQVAGQVGVDPNKRRIASWFEVRL